MKRRHAGFSLVELLAAGAMFLTLLGALSALFVSSGKAYRKNIEVSSQLERSEAATQILTYDFGLAGYRGTGFSHFTANSFSGSTVAITAGSSTNESDLVSLRYFEDRYGNGGNQEMLVTFKVQNKQLLRQLNQETAAALIDSVHKFKAYFIPKLAHNSLSLDNPPIGIQVELWFSDQSKQVITVPFANQQSPGISGPILQPQ